MSHNSENLHSDCESNIEADWDASTNTDSEGRSSDSTNAVTDDENVREAECTDSHKTIEECLITIENLEETCTKLHNKCKSQQENLDIVTKRCALAVKEKDLMVMRYAVGEKAVLDLKLAKESAEKKHKDVCKENEILQRKLSTMSSEKVRICQMLDGKGYDLKCNQQETEKLKLDINNLETELKWSRNGLKVEKELRKESDVKVESFRTKVQEQISEVEQSKRESQEAIKAFYYSQENRATVLDQQLKEQQATLILLRHEKEDKDKQLKLLQTDFENLQTKEKQTSEDNCANSAKLQILDRQHSEATQRVNELQSSEDQLVTENRQLKELAENLQRELEEKSNANEQTDLLKNQIFDLETDLVSCRERESDLLSFTQQLTNKNVQLLSEFTALETKVQQLKCEQEFLKKNSTDYESKIDSLTKQLVNDRLKFATENTELTKQLDTKNKLCESLLQEVSDQKGENSIIKRKYELSLKEVNKELLQCRKKLDQLELASHSSNSSSSSLNVIDQPHSLYADGDQVKVIQPELTVDKKTLVEHIVKLQRISARKSEKIDFLEEHVNTLVADLQQKTHLLQNYMIREQTGALSSNKMDKNKANIAKLNGVMASVYGSRVADNNLTLELSLDINHKLQAVAEDALLKNITLKENIDTLGAEIDKLNNLLKSSYSNAVNT